MFKISSFGEILFDIYPNSKNLGGAPLNFIFHVSKFTNLGCLLSRVGNDKEGKNAINFLNANSIETKFIQVDEINPTGKAIVTLSEKKQPSFKIEESCAYDFIEAENNAVKLIEDKTDCLYYGTLAQRNEKSRNTLRSFFNKNIKYFCDLNLRQNFYNDDILSESLNAANVLKINSDELKVINNIFIKDDFELIETTKKVFDKFKLELIAVTNGSEGSILFDGKTIDNNKAKTGLIIDTLGAGDAYASILCIGFLNNWKLAKINSIANQFAADICGIQGALPKENKLYKKYKSALEN